MIAGLNFRSGYATPNKAVRSRFLTILNKPCEHIPHGLLADLLQGAGFVINDSTNNLHIVTLIESGIGQKRQTTNRQ